MILGKASHHDLVTPSDGEFTQVTSWTPAAGWENHSPHGSALLFVELTALLLVHHLRVVCRPPGDF